jgi:hypothetical protein
MSRKESKRPPRQFPRLRNGCDGRTQGRTQHTNSGVKEAGGGGASVIVSHQRAHVLMSQPHPTQHLNTLHVFPAAAPVSSPVIGSRCVSPAQPTPAHPAGSSNPSRDLTPPAAADLLPLLLLLCELIVHVLLYNVPALVGLENSSGARPYRTQATTSATHLPTPHPHSVYKETTLLALQMILKPTFRGGSAATPSALV